jgi:hypothetical protein
MLMAFERERSRCDCWIDSEVLPPTRFVSVTMTRDIP